jgi:bla regulator protein blaR1
MRRAIPGLLILAIGAFAQTPAFETASIRPTPPDSQCSNGSIIEPLPGGGLRVECVGLKSLLTWAYEVQNYQVSGGPSWMAAESWNILAKPAAPEGPQDGPAEYAKMNDTQRTRYMAIIRQRLQALLADRFQLVLRHESREQTVYALTIAKNGPKLKESADQSVSGFLKRGRGNITGKGAQMETLVKFLAIDVLRPVADETHLTAHYDFTLDWTPDRPASATPGAETASDPTGPTIFTAIEEQLGLRLESRKMPVDTLIIDRIEKPSEN